MEASLDGPDVGSFFENRDLRFRYVFEAHFLAIWLLHLCSFPCLTDRALFREETMYHRMRAGQPELLARLKRIAFEFQLCHPSDKRGTRAPPLRCPGSQDRQPPSPQDVRDRGQAHPDGSRGKRLLFEYD